MVKVYNMSVTKFAHFHLQELKYHSSAIKFFYQATLKKYVCFPSADRLKGFYLNFRSNFFFYFRNFGSVSVIVISVFAFYYNRKLLLIRSREWFCKHVFHLLLVETMAYYEKGPRNSKKDASKMTWKII